MRRALFILLMAGLPAFAADDQNRRPVCSEKVWGTFWPAEANSDRAEMQASARAGTLEICSYGRWRYEWKSLSVRYSPVKQGKTAKNRPNAGVEERTAPPEEAAAKVPSATE